MTDPNAWYIRTEQMDGIMYKLSMFATSVSFVSSIEAARNSAYVFPASGITRSAVWPMRVDDAAATRAVAARLRKNPRRFIARCFHTKRVLRWRRSARASVCGYQCP